MNIFVGSLPFSLKEDDLRGYFEEYGEVTSVKIIVDKFSGRSKGYGFIEMPDDEMAKKAIQELNGSQVEGRTIVVNKAEKRREDQGRGNFRSGNRSGGNYRGGRNGHRDSQDSDM